MMREHDEAAETAFVDLRTPCQLLGRLRTELASVVDALVGLPGPGAKAQPGTTAGTTAGTGQDDRFLAGIVECSNDAIVGYSLQGTIISWNAGATQLYGYEAHQMLGRDAGILAPPDRAVEISVLLQRLGDHEVVEPYETQAVHRSGQVLDVAVSLAAVLDDDGAVIGAASISRDITESKRSEERLEYQALHDPLTNLPNRNLLRDRLQLALVRTERSSAAVGVLFIDLDNFKLVNDTAGHSVGDQVLRMISERLVHTVRPDDTVGRFGGDEFVVVCPDVHDESEAFAVSRRIAEAFMVPFQHDGGRFDVSMSVGVVIGRSNDSVDALLRRADAAMYQEKQRRKLQNVSR